MAQLNITLNQEEILQLLTNNKEEAFKKLFQERINAFILAEPDEQLGVSRYERSNFRTDRRNRITCSKTQNPTFLYDGF